MKRFFCVCCLLVGCLLLLPALGEDGGVGVTVGFRGNGREQVHYAITRPDLIERIRAEMQDAREAPLPERIHTAATMINPLTLTLDGNTYTLFYDDLYHQTWMEKDGQGFSLPSQLGAGLIDPAYQWLDKDLPDFSVDPAWVAFLQPYGWTPFFTLSDMEIRLPDQLTASNTDESDLYFTWAQLFCKDAGFDLTPYLGKTVRAAVLGLWEKMGRNRFSAFELQPPLEVPVSLRCVILHAGDTVIGAFIAPGRIDGSWMASLTGHTAKDLLGTDDPTGYLLSCAAPTEQEKENAQKPLEEIIALYLAAGPEESTGLDLRAELLRGLTINMNDDTLFRTRKERWAQALSWMQADGIQPRRPGRVVNIGPAYEDARDEFLAEMADGSLYRVCVAWESDQTGWKIIYVDLY